MICKESLQHFNRGHSTNEISRNSIKYILKGFYKYIKNICIFFCNGILILFVMDPKEPGIDSPINGPVSAEEEVKSGLDKYAFIIIREKIPLELYMSDHKINNIFLTNILSSFKQLIITFNTREERLGKLFSSLFSSIFSSRCSIFRWT